MTNIFEEIAKMDWSSVNAERDFRKLCAFLLGMIKGIQSPEMQKALEEAKQVPEFKKALELVEAISPSEPSFDSIIGILDPHPEAASRFGKFIKVLFKQKLKEVQKE